MPIACFNHSKAFLYFDLDIPLFQFIIQNVFCLNIYIQPHSCALQALWHRNMMGPESGCCSHRRGRNVCPWNQTWVEKKGHEYLACGVERPRDGCMGQKEEGEHWEDSETQIKKPLRLKSSWLYTPSRNLPFFPCVARLPLLLHV